MRSIVRARYPIPVRTAIAPARTRADTGDGLKWAAGVRRPFWLRHVRCENCHTLETIFPPWLLPYAEWTLMVLQQAAAWEVDPPGSTWQPRPQSRSWDWSWLLVAWTACFVALWDEATVTQPWVRGTLGLPAWRLVAPEALPAACVSAWTHLGRRIRQGRGPPTVAVGGAQTLPPPQTATEARSWAGGGEISNDQRGTGCVGTLSLSHHQPALGSGWLASRSSGISGLLTGASQAHPPTAPTGQAFLPSPRSLRRYVRQYQQGGFEALRPQPRADIGTLRAIPTELWDQIVALKREVPERSAEQVLALLTAWAPTVGIAPATVARVRRATLYRQWARHGLTRRQLRVAAPKRYHRWEATAPGDLWQTDVMNGPYLPDPTAEDPDRKRATYCLTLIDDYSRRVVAGQFAWSADSVLLEQLLWEAFLRWGVPRRLYTDQGAIYTSDRLDLICGRLDIRLVHTPPYTPQGKGKQERWWRHLQTSFLPELRAEPAESLGQLNTWFAAWCEQHYHRRVHSETGGPLCSAGDRRRPSTDGRGDSPPGVSH